MGIGLVTPDREGLTIATDESVSDRDSSLVQAMVFQFIRADDFDKQDIVSMKDILT